MRSSWTMDAYENMAYAGRTAEAALLWVDWHTPPKANPISLKPNGFGKPLKNSWNARWNCAPPEKPKKPYNVACWHHTFSPKHSISEPPSHWRTNRPWCLQRNPADPNRPISEPFHQPENRQTRINIKARAPQHRIKANHHQEGQRATVHTDGTHSTRP
jgi:hypothetical protein